MTYEDEKRVREIAKEEAGNVYPGCSFLILGAVFGWFIIQLVATHGIEFRWKGDTYVFGGPSQKHD